jgi:hypothetical protein
LKKVPCYKELVDGDADDVFIREAGIHNMFLGTKLKESAKQEFFSF